MELVQSKTKQKSTSMERLMLLSVADTASSRKSRALSLNLALTSFDVSVINVVLEDGIFASWAYRSWVGFNFSKSGIGEEGIAVDVLELWAFAFFALFFFFRQNQLFIIVL